MKAHEILIEAAKILEERGKLRDTEQGERSMARAVSAFNALVPEKALDEGQGWLFMCCLKMARATSGKAHLDDQQDLSGYAALWGEWVAKQSSQNEIAISTPWGGLPPPPVGFRYNPEDLKTPPYPNKVYRMEETGLNSDATSDDGWIPWAGGDCPVPNGVRVEVKTRGGVPVLSRYEMSPLWKHSPHAPEYDIIAYKVVD